MTFYDAVMGRLEGLAVGGVHYQENTNDDDDIVYPYIVVVPVTQVGDPNFEETLDDVVFQVSIFGESDGEVNNVYESVRLRLNRILLPEVDDYNVSRLMRLSLNRLKGEGRGRSTTEIHHYAAEYSTTLQPV